MCLRLFMLVVVGLMTGCATPTAAPTEVLETQIIVTPTPIPTAEPTPPGPGTLKIWWTESLAALDKGDAAELLSEQISGFQAANVDVVVEFRLKKAQDSGGVMSTLRTASLVAPGALPDLTLLRRGDLLAAAQSGLILPIDELAAPVLDNLPPMVAALGRVNDRLYGLPYSIEVQHLAYQQSVTPPESWSFDDLLAAQFAFVFPAGRANALSDVFLAQYRAATGMLESSTLEVDTDQLQKLFAFYEQAVAERVTDPIVLDYILPTDYRFGLENGGVEAGVVTSTLYLQMVANGAQLDFAPIPTASGEPVTVVDGWVWVLTSADSAQQELAIRFVNWMLDADRQGDYNQAIAMLPSQRTALRQREDADYVAFVDTLLNNATLPLPETTGGVTARAIQSALATVISGERTADQAVQDVVAQLPN